LVADSLDVSHFTERAACMFIGQAMTSPSQSTPDVARRPHYIMPDGVLLKNPG
jgi:hypothetical protein